MSPTTPARTWRLGEPPWQPADPAWPGARARVIIDNDLAGDPDGLVALAHHLLCPSVEIRAIIGSHNHPDDDPGYGASAAAAARRARELAAVMGLELPDGLIIAGPDRVMSSPDRPIDSPAARAVVAEVMREDPRPLIIAVGGGLGTLASALLMEPRVAERARLVWIGGEEYDAPAEPDRWWDGPECNATIDPIATRVVLESSTIPTVQVTRELYMRCLVSRAEIAGRLRPTGPAGAWLADRLLDWERRMWAAGTRSYETNLLGDSPLVLLTALNLYFAEPPFGMRYRIRPAMHLGDDARFRPDPAGRPLRVVTELDTRLMFEDMFAKLTALGHWQQEHIS